MPEDVERKSFNKKPIIAILAIIVIAVVGRFVLLRNPDTQPMHTVESTSLIDTIQVGGSYVLGMQKDVVTTSSGIVTELYVRDGDVVEEGDDLFRVVSTATRDEKARALASYQSALATFKTAESNYRAKEATVDKVYDEVQGHEDDESFEMRDTRTTAEANRDNAYYALESAQASLDSAYLDYLSTQDITITAPVSGTVVNLLKQVGDHVLTVRGSGVNLKPAETVLVIANLKSPYLEVTINEAYLPRLTQSLPVKIVFDALDEKEFVGSLDSYEKIGTNGSGVVGFDARIRMTEKDDRILPGMTAIATIQTFKKDNVLTVPNSALIERDGEFWVINEGGDEVFVTLGHQGISHSEVLSGLSEGDVVFANPRHE